MDGNNQPSRDLQSRDSTFKMEPSSQPSEDIIWIPAQPSRDPRLQSNEKMPNQSLEDPLWIPAQPLRDPRLQSNEKMPDPFEYLESSWKDEDNISENSEDNCDAAGYVTPPPTVSSDEMTTDEEDTESDVSTEDSSSDDDSSEEEESDAEERYRNRVLDLILQWMQHIYLTKLEEEIIMLRNCDGLIDWTHARFEAFKLLCQQEIEDTRQQLREGSILVPISKEKTEE